MENTKQEVALLLPVSTESAGDGSNPFWRGWFFWRVARYEVNAMCEVEAAANCHVEYPMVGVRVYGSFQPSPINPTLDYEQTRPYAMVQRDVEGNLNLRVQARFGSGRIIESVLYPVQDLMGDITLVAHGLAAAGNIGEATRYPAVLAHRYWTSAAREALATRYPSSAAVFERLKLAA